jgi:hypothetical protein
MSFCWLGNPQKSLTVQAKASSSSCSEMWTSAHPKSFIIITQWHAVSFLVYADSKECDLTCIQGTVEDAARVIAFDWCDSFLIELLHAWGGGVRLSTWIFRWVRPRSCGYHGAFSRMRKVWNARILDFRYSFYTSLLYWHGLVPHHSMTEWQPSLSFIHTRRPFWFLWGKGHSKWHSDSL